MVQVTKSQDLVLSVIEGGKSEHSSFPPFDGANFQAELFWLLITFTILYFVLSKITLPALKRFIENRRNIIKTNLEFAKDLKQKIETEISIHNEALKNSKSKSEEALLEAKQSALSLFEKNKALTDKQNNDELNLQIANLLKDKDSLFNTTDDISSKLSKLIMQRIIA